jgi:methyltransferase
MLEAQMGEGGYLVAFLVAQRLAELALATRNTRRLRVAGGVEFGATHYPLLVALHAFWLIGLWVYGHDRSIAPVGLVAFVILQLGRVWVIASLGPRWTTRIIVVPGSAAVMRRPYRWLRHPNYFIVVLEIAVVPLALGLPLLAFVFSILNAALLAYRIQIENRALAWAAATGGVNAANQATHSATLANDTPRR